VASGDIEPETFEGWLTPKQAVEKLDPDKKGSRLWRDAVLERLRGGIITAIAETVTYSGPRARNMKRQSMAIMQPELWTQIHWNDDLWNTGDITIETAYAPFDTLTMRCFNVRLEPSGVRQLLPPQPHPRSVSVPRDGEEVETETEEPEPKGPRVSDPHLKAWFDLYRQVYTGAAETEANAVASARGMFPSKSVSRDRIRALRGSQKRGPKGPRNSD
jgi:hypothetical protein